MAVVVAVPGAAESGPEPIRPTTPICDDGVTVMTDLKTLFSDLIRFETELWNAIDARLRGECNLPLSWFEPMQVIARRGACRVNDIAEELVITVGGTSKLVDRIEAAGHCRRRSNPHDGRSSIIELTATGRRLLNAATQTFEAELAERLESAASPRTLQQFSSTLTRLRLANSRARAVEDVI
jgi:MarR family transcriptional regulator, organic hydroperoxide resistance regulator